MKDWIVCSCCKLRKTEGCWSEKGCMPGSEWAQSLHVHVPWISQSIWTLISNLKTLSTTSNPLCTYPCVSMWYTEGLKLQHVDYKGYLAPQRMDYRRQGSEQFLQPVLWNVLMAAAELKQGGTEMRAGGVVSWVFPVLVVLLCLSQSLIWKQLP